MQKFDHRSPIYGTIGTQEQVLIRQGKRAISVRATEGLLYQYENRHCQFSSTPQLRGISYDTDKNDLQQTSHKYVPERSSELILNVYSIHNKCQYPTKPLTTSATDICVVETIVYGSRAIQNFFVFTMATIKIATL